MTKHFTTLLFLGVLFLSPNIRAASSKPKAKTTTTSDEDPLSRIKHVIVLVQENRSYDHLFGFFKQTKAENLVKYPNGFFNNLEPTNSSSPKVYTGTGATFVSKGNPKHEHESVTFQLYGSNSSTLEEGPYPPANMSGFLKDTVIRYNGNFEDAQEVMKSFTPEQLPIYYKLANEFAVFDRWFASVPGPTLPNRLFIHSATSNGFTIGEHTDSHVIYGFPQKSIFQSLYEAGKDFKVFYHDGPSSAYFKWMRHPSIMLTRFHQFGSTLGFGGFVNACKSGDLPEYTFIEPRFFDSPFGYANDDHPPHDVRNGQEFIKEIYETVRNSPIWESTLLIITHDEHGGFFDHVPPPKDGIPNPDGLVAGEFHFDRLGVRVPTIMISPWIKKGTVVSRPPNGPFETSEYEHSSIAATLKKLFGLPNFLTRRDEWAGTFEHLWANSTLKSPRTDCPIELPEVTWDEGVQRKNEAMLTESQESLLKLMSAMNTGNTQVKGMSPAKARGVVSTFWKSIKEKMSRNLVKKE